MKLEDEIYALFQRQHGEGAISQMLQYIENYSVILSDADQKKAIAYKVLIEAGRGKELPADSVNDIMRIFKQISAEVAKSLEAEPVLSMGKVLYDLSTAKKMLNAEETRFFQGMLGKVVQKQPISREEAEALLRLYTRKGF